MKYNNHQLSKLGIEIKPRQVHFQFSEGIGRYWHGSEAFKTAFSDALLSTFTVGEIELFVFSVRQVKERVNDPLLKKSVQGFIAQECTHAKQHQFYSDHLEKTYGHQIRKWDRRLKKFLRLHQRIFSHKTLLAMTVCLEHITALIGNLTLRRKIFNDADCGIKPFLEWHALEELEHKGVCSDVYSAINGGYFRRILMMPYVLIVLLFPVVTLRTLAMLKCNRKLGSVKAWFNGFRYLLVSQEGLRLLFGYQFFRFFLPSFHPWRDNDDYELIQKYMSKYSNYF